MRRRQERYGERHPPSRGRLAIDGASSGNRGKEGATWPKIRFAGHLWKALTTNSVTKIVA